MANDIVFRRVRGRVIPIRNTTPKNKVPAAPKKEPAIATKATKQAAFSVGLGSTIAAAGGAASAWLDRRHAEMFNAARNARTDLFRGAKRGFAARTRLEGIRAGAASRVIKRGAAGLGAALIGAGTYKLLDKKSDLTTEQKAAVASGVGLGAHFAVRSTYTKLLGNTSWRWAAKHAIQRVLIKGGKI